MEKTYLDYKNQGNKLYKDGKYEKAITQYQKAINQPKDNELQNKAIYHNLALCYYKLQKYQQSAQCCSKAIELDQHYSKAYYRRLFSQMKMDLHYEAYIDGLLFVRQCQPDEKAQVQDLNIKNKEKFLANLINFKADDEFFMKSLEIVSKVQQKQQQLKKKVQRALQNRQFWQALNEINYQIKIAEGQSKQKLQIYYNSIKKKITKLKNQKQQIAQSQEKQQQQDLSVNQLQKQAQLTQVTQTIDKQQEIKIQVTNNKPQSQNKQLTKQNQQQTTENTQQASYQPLTSQLSQSQVQNIQNSAQISQQLDDLYKKHVSAYLNQSRDIFDDFFKMNQYLFTKSNLSCQQIRVLILQIRKKVGDLKILTKGLSGGQKKKIINYFKQKGLEDLLYQELN